MSDDERILLLAPRGRDAQVLEQILARESHICVVCDSLDALAEALPKGGGAAVLTEESLLNQDVGKLSTWLHDQAPWSDFPFILLATKRTGRRPRSAARALERLGNVVVIERPVHSETLVSAVTSAVRGRRRQYEAQRHLGALERAEERLRQMNATLEIRIARRTQELGRLNDQLLQEIAEREKAQTALAQSQKIEALGQLTGGIAHDFNNLLTVINGNLELIQRRASDERTTRLAGMARQAADRATKLTGQLLAFSRIQRLQLKALDVTALIRDMEDLLLTSIGPMFKIELRLESEPIWAMADANQVELAILNLAINARDAMPDGGVLHIGCTRSHTPPPPLKGGDYVVISVRDEGTGIPADLLEKVFDPFFTTKPMGKGTGLGLSQVYGLARQSDGTVRIDSTEHVGTTVELWLPQAAPQIEAAPVLENEPEIHCGRERVLVVEDDAGVRQFIVECLEIMGYVVSQAADGEAGLGQIRAEPPELLICDFAMPGLNGAEVVSQALSFAPNLPVILATGYADMAAVNRVVDPARVLRKPFQIGDLQLAVREALAEAALARVG